MMDQQSKSSRETTSLADVNFCSSLNARYRSAAEPVKSRSATAARLPDFVEPMKAKLVGSMPSGDWIYEIKFDGYRALALHGGSETRVKLQH
jgi:bifunctional non-homologous end joining protein LigD